MEEALGVPLLKRGRRGVELTAAGENLLGHARVIVHNVETMRGDLQAFARGLKASVHLLANTSGLSEYLPKLLAAFLQEHPHVNIDVEERESSGIATAIAAAPRIWDCRRIRAAGQHRANPLQRRSPGACRRAAG